MGPILGPAPHITFSMYIKIGISLVRELSGLWALLAFLQGSGADLADFDGHAVATHGRFPSPSAPHLDVEDIGGGGSDGCEAGFQAREMGTSCVRLAWRQSPVGPRI